MRIELTTSAWKADVLPLNYTRMLFWLAVDIPTTNLYCVSSPRSRSKLGRCSNFNHFSVFAIRGVEIDIYPSFLAGAEGFEPSVHRVKVCCLTVRQCSSVGGEGGIRTPRRLTPSAVFKTAPFTNSGTSPFGTPGGIRTPITRLSGAYRL